MSGVNILLYGPPGVGKTVLSASGDGTVLLNVEGGTLSIQDRVKAKKVIVKDCNDFPTLEANVQEIREKMPKQVKTLVLDSATETQQKLNEWIVSSHPEMGSKRPYGDGMMLSDWGYSIERMRRFVRMLRDLPYNVVITALSQEVKNESTGTVTTMPQMSGKLAADVCGYMDIVGYLYAEQQEGEEEPVRKLLTQPVQGFYAKDRSGKLPMVLERPTLDQIIALALGQ